jgi:hydrogenase nickel incorporation protein HypA/HybF
VKSALQSCYEMACENTALQGSQLIVEEVPVIVYCPSCRANRPLSSIQFFSCAECGALTSQVVQGRELEVVALEIQDEPRATLGGSPQECSEAK